VNAGKVRFHNRIEGPETSTENNRQQDAKL